ncbi:MAG: ribonucleoside-diphosphate reductase subunit alpha, partial [bacterium]|nr:ribonucleoside-diphosphate reductase subunit alpha [bacterium]
IFEMIYFAAMEASMEVAKEDGAYETFEGSDLSKGIFQFDYWEESQLSPNLNLDWNKLKEQVKEHGARNSLLLAPMPTASTAQILGNNECFEPYTSNIYERKVLSGNFVLVNPHLIERLIGLKLWNEEMRNKIIANRGSVQGIEDIPEDIQDVYKTVWEIKQKHVLEMAADRGAFICQSQSMNVFMDEPDFAKLTSMHFYGWSKGLKTGMYYLRTKPAADAIQFTVEKKAVEEEPQDELMVDYDDLPERPDESDFECFGCGA